MPVLRVFAAVVASLAVIVGCSGDNGGSGGVEGLEQARAFAGHPLYWVGTSFEGLELRHVTVGSAAGPRAISGLAYGECEARGDMGCPVPLDIQIRPLCAGVAAAARDRRWAARQLRGAPLGTFDGAPVLFTSRVQIKVYALEQGQALRVLRALRSLNPEPPVVEPGDPIPPAPRAVLEGRRPCTAA